MSTLGDSELPDAVDIALLVAHYRPDALRVARRLVRTEAEAEDLTQTAVLNVLRRAQHIHERANVKAYLLTTVRNLWRNQLRQQGSRRFVNSDAADQLPAFDDSPEERALTALDAEIARLAFGSLSSTSQRILTLRYVDGLGFVEMAESLGISPVAARQRAHRAREELVSACIEFTASANARSCTAIRGRFGRYLRGRLSRGARRQITGHLEICRACRRCYDDLRETYGALLGPSRERRP